MSTFTASTLLDTAEGHTLAPGQQTDRIDPDHPHNRRLIEAGRLVQNAEKAPPTKAELLDEAKALEITGRSTMTVEELREAVETAKQAPDQGDSD